MFRYYRLRDSNARDTADSTSIQAYRARLRFGGSDSGTSFHIGANGHRRRLRGGRLSHSCERSARVSAGDLRSCNRC